MDQEAAVTANRIYTYASTNTLDGYLSEKNISIISVLTVIYSSGI